MREIRDEIEHRVRRLLDEDLTAIRSDSTAHELRLARLLPSLVTEFREERTPEEIRWCADAILDRFSDATVRSYVQALVLRKARECLRAEVCDPQAA